MKAHKLKIQTCTALSLVNKTFLFLFMFAQMCSQRRKMKKTNTKSGTVSMTLNSSKQLKFTAVFFLWHFRNQTISIKMLMELNIS